MKILMLQDFFGLEESYQENLLTKHYIRLGYQVVVIASTFESNFDYKNDNYKKIKGKSIQSYHGAKIIKLPYSLNIFNKLRRHAGVYEIIKQEQPNLIYAHDIHLNLKEAVQYVKINPECRIIMDYHSDFSNSANGWLSLHILHKIIRKFFLYRYIKHINKIYPVVPASADFLHSVYGIPYDRMELLPLGCDYQTSMQVLNSVDVTKFRQKFEIKEGDFVIFTGGRLEPGKKTELIIEALRKINDKNIHLVIVGTATNENSSYEMMLKEHSSDLNVHYVGWLNQQQILEMMAIADVAIFPSSQSVLWQQSIGMHLPLIVGEVKSQSAEYLNLYNNVITIKSKDISVDKLIYYIDLLKSNPQLLAEMKKGAQKVAENYLDYRVICKTTTTS